MKIWLARDKYETLWLYTYKPRKGDEKWEQTNTCMIMDGFLYTEVKWSDSEPTKVKLEIVK